MSLNLSQLTLPQIAHAVASGEVNLEEAEAELKRRPAAEPKRRPPPPRIARPRPVSQPAAQVAPADLLRMIEDTRQEMRQTQKHLRELARRLDSLALLAGMQAQAQAQAEAEPPVHRSPARPPRTNPRRRIETALPLMGFDDAA